MGGLARRSIHGEEEINSLCNDFLYKNHYSGAIEGLYALAASTVKK